MADDVLIGFEDLVKKLGRLEAETSAKVTRNALMYATSPTVRGMKAAAPKGDDAHRTYKNRLVTPGFLSRSVKRAAKINKRTGTVTLRIGVKSEAFYGVTFLDEGIQVNSRNGKPIKPYKISGQRWFKQRFENDEARIIERFRERLAANIRKVSA